jgi:hypothetical protein
MRSAVIPGALALATLTVPVACGAEQQSSQTADAGETSARFSDVTNYVVEGEERDEVITGAFDWAKRQGWTKGTYGGSTGFRVQIGGDCFSQDAGKDWKHWRAGGKRGFCSDTFWPPQELLDELRSNGSLESVGQEEVRGVSTTHYRVVPNEDTDDPDQWLDVWLDKGDVVHRFGRPAGEASPRFRDYFDFGVGVDVKPPCRVEPEASTTLTPDKGEQTRCIEEGL